MKPVQLLIFAFALVTAGCNRTISDDQQISNVIARFWDGFRQQSLPGVTAVWDENSEEFVPAREELRILFREGKVSISGLVNRPAQIDRDTAKVWSAVKIQATDTQSGRNLLTPRKDERLFELRRVKGQWRIERFAPAEQELADGLMAGKSAAARDQLRKNRHDLVTDELVRLISDAATRRSESGDRQTAVAWFDIAEESASSVADSFARGYALRSRGTFEFNNGNHRRALDLHSKAVELFHGAGDRSEEAHARSDEGWELMASAKDKEFLAEIAESIRLSHGYDRREEARALKMLGEFYRRHNDLDKAVGYAETSLKLSREVDDRRAEDDVMNNLANARMLRGEPKKAIELFTQCLKTDRELRNPHDEADTLGNLGVAYEMSTQFDEARKMQLASLAQHEQLEDNEGAVGAMVNLGLLDLETGKPTAALEWFDKCYSRAGDIANKVACRGNAGAAYKAEAKFELALAAYNDAIALAQTMHDSGGVAKWTASIGDVYKSRGDLDEAIESFLSSRRIFAGEHMRMEEAIALQQIAAIYVVRGDYPDAVTTLKDSILLHRRIQDLYGEADATARLSDAFRGEGLYRQAESSARRAILLSQKAGDPETEGQADIALARTLQIAGRNTDSAAAFQSAVNLGERSGAVEIEVAGHAGLGAIRAGEKNWSEAQNECRQAAKLTEDVRTDALDAFDRMKYASQNQAAYECLVRALIGKGDASGALQASDAAKAQALRDTLSGAATVDAGLSAAEKNQLGDLQARIDDLADAAHSKPSARLLDSLREARRQMADIRRRHTAGTGPVIAAAPGTTIDPSAYPRLPAERGMAILEYQIGGETSTVFVTKPTSVPGNAATVAIPLPINRQSIRKLTQGFLAALAHASDRMTGENALYQALIAPADPVLADTTTLGIIPDDSLWEIPFAALCGSSKPCSSSKQYLVQKRAVFYAPSLAVLARTFRMRAALTASLSSALLVGNPVVGPARSLASVSMKEPPALIAASLELNGIRDEAKSRGITPLPLSGPDALKATVMSDMPRFDVIHFATHGQLDDNDPLHSRILLTSSGAGRDDGVLDAREMLDMKLKASLVVLSACNTAVAGMYGGEGPVGFSWALFAAGVPSSILTQWGVDDPSTASLMTGFYKAWGFGKGKSKVAALHEAQLGMLHADKWSNPYFWAPFVLIGDPR